MAVNFRIIDALDVAIVSVFFYALLSWLYYTATRTAAIGAAVLGGVYLLARSLGMVLTTTVFQAGAIVLLVALVIVFQEDVRRGFQRLPLGGGALHWWRRRSEDATRQTVELLVEMSMRLAKTRTGAILVLAGREPLDAHLSSGIPVSGQLSTELVLSIFQPESPGHDGAVVIHRGALQQFASHLPLAHRPLGPEMRGTRHRAAVGLSERCDAAMIVVSEERGAISIAEAGELSEVASSDQLRQRLNQFFDSRFRVSSTSHSVFKSITTNLHLKAISVVLAVAAWGLLVATAGTIHRTYAVPIEYRNLPEHLALADDAPQEARVTMAGPEIAFRTLDPSLLRITVDVAEARPKANYFLLTKEDLRYPPQLSVEHLTPRQILVVVEQESEPPPAQGSQTESTDE